MKKLITAAALGASLLALVAVAEATGPGITRQLTPVPLACTYLGINCHAAVAAKQINLSSLTNEFTGAFRGEVSADKGGTYGGAGQSGFIGFNAGLNIAAQGQGIGFWSYVKGRGKGNAISMNGVVDCYGGGEIYDGSGSSTPECAALGEFEADQGTKIFSGTISSAGAGATTIAYSSPTNEDVSGSRLILSLNHIYGAGSVSSVAGNVITFTGTALTSSPLTSGTWYVKIGTNNDNYAPGCGTGDVSLANNGSPKCVGHWYRITSFGDATHATLAYPYDSVHLPTSGTYLMAQGEEAIAVDTVAHTFTFPTNTLSWAATDTFYSPPNHVMSLIGANYIFQKYFKTGLSTASSEGVRIVNRGPQKMDYGMRITGLDASNGGFETGIIFQLLGASSRAIDVANDVQYGLVLHDGDATCSKNSVAMGNNGQDLQCYDGTYHRFYGAPVAVSNGVAPNGGGLKHKRLTTGSINASTTTTVNVAWDTAFANTNYTVTCSVVDSSGANLQVINMNTPAAGSVDVRVKNNDGGSAHTGTLHCQAMHD